MNALWVGFGEKSALVLLFHCSSVVEEVGGEERQALTHDMQMQRLWLANSSVRHSNKTNSTYRETQREGEWEKDRDREPLGSLGVSGWLNTERRAPRGGSSFCIQSLCLRECIAGVREPGRCAARGPRLQGPCSGKKSHLGAPQRPELISRTQCTAAGARPGGAQLFFPLSPVALLFVISHISPISPILLFPYFPPNLATSDMRWGSWLVRHWHL